MLSRLIHLLTSETGLLAEHAAAYAQLAAAESAEAAAVIRRRLFLRATALLAASLGLSSAVMALLLAAVIPVANMPAPWALIVVPLVLCGVAGGFWRYAMGLEMPTPFAELRRQFAQDAELLRQMEAR